MGRSKRISIGASTLLAFALVASTLIASPAAATGTGLGPNGRTLIAGGSAPRGMAIQDDGAIVWGSRRYLSDGSVDPSFASTASAPGGNSVAFRSSDGKFVTTPASVSKSLGYKLYSPTGTLLSTVSTVVAVYSATDGTVLVQPDGKVIVAGYGADASSGPNTIRLARFMPDGTVDTGFGNSGVVKQLVGSTGSSAMWASLTPSGQILVATVGPPTVSVARFNADGTLDTSYGTQGGYSWELSSQLDGMAMGPTGDVFLLLHRTSGAPRLVVHYTTDGQLDTSFGGTGTITVLPASASYTTPGLRAAAALAVQADGKVIVGGAACCNTPMGVSEFGAVRYNVDGTLDTSFANGGYFLTDLPGSATSVSVQTDGKIVLAGTASANTAGFTGGSVIMRLQSNGTRDGSTFADLEVTAAGPATQQRATEFGTVDVIVTITNNGPAPATNVNIGVKTNKTLLATDTLSGSQGVACTGAPSGWRLWCLGTIAPGASATATFTKMMKDGSFSVSTAVFGDQIGTDGHTTLTPINLLPAQGTLTVIKGGTNQGTITGLNVPLDCGSVCSTQVDYGYWVLLQATPDPGVTFKGWTVTCEPVGLCPSQATVCTGTATTCNFNMVPLWGSMTVAANFNDTNKNYANVTFAGTGSGQVSGLNGSCTNSCSLQTSWGLSKTLTATANAGSRFAGWSGDCTTSLSACTLMYTTDHNVTATFTKQWTLAAAKYGTGAGTVTAGSYFSCGSVCSKTIDQGQVTMTATPNVGSIFSGWGGACSYSLSTTCVVNVDAAKTVNATFDQARTLTVLMSGSGSVTSTPLGVNCVSDCTATFALGTTVTLAATPTAGYSFTGWQGACTGTASTCVVTLDASKTVQAIFDPMINYTLTTSKTGSGTLTSSPAGISCGSTCSFGFTSGTSVTLSQSADPGFTFTGWSGACSGSAPTCVVTMDAAKSVGATFTAVPTYTLTAQKKGAGSGIITSSPAGITCPGTCSKAYNSGTPVTLTATPAFGSRLTGWGGACAGIGTSPTCVVTMDAAKTAAATFKLLGPDALIKKASDATYIGDGIYNAGGTGQMFNQTVARGNTASFDMLIDNDGAAADTFKLGSCTEPAGFNLTVKDDSNNDVTAAVIAGTYPLGSVSPGSPVHMSVSVKVQAGATVGTKITCPITATSTTNATLFDAVKVVIKAS